MVSTKEESKTQKARSIRLGLVSGIIVATLILSISVPWVPVIEQDEETREWRVLWKGPLTDLVRAEGDPGAGVSGILGIWFVNATADSNPNASYGAWLNNSFTLSDWCNASNLGFSYADDFYTEIAHSTTFDIVVRVRGNKTICGNSTGAGGIFRADWLRVNITAAAPLSLTDKPMYGNISSNTSTDPYIWMYFFLSQDQGGGTFSITKDSSCAITEIRFEAYY